MAQVGSSRVDTTTTISAADSHEIINLTLGSANTEVSQALQSNVKKFMVKSRGLALLKLAYTSTESGTKYITIHPNAVKWVDDIDVSSLTLYIQSPKAGAIVEIESWA